MSGAPMATPLAKKATCVIVAPVLGVAVALTVDAVFTVTVLPAVGAVTVTVGVVPFTVTDTAGEVVVAPPDWVAIAVRLTTPAPVGVQTTEYGMAVSLAISVPLA